MTTQEPNHAEAQAVAQVDAIIELLAAHECDYDRLEELRNDLRALKNEWRDVIGDVDASEDDRDSIRQELWDWREYNDAELNDLVAAAGDYENPEQAYEALVDNALSQETRSAWESLGDILTPAEYRVVLCTGGPHVEIVGDLDSNGDPYTARVIYKGWVSSGELFDFDHDAVLRYVSMLNWSV